MQNLVQHVLKRSSPPKEEGPQTKFSVEGEIYGFYAALLHEYHSDLILPQIAVEVKRVEAFFRQEAKKMLIQLDFPLEVLYFNRKLNFYEPLVERSALTLQLEQVEKQGRLV